jgi:mono/diheme cytochrome c family protein
MRFTLRSAVAAGFGLAALCAVTALAQPAQGTVPAAGGTVTRDEHQRSLYLWEYHATAKSGPQRGEEIYFFKCWFCHNKYQKTGPYLKDLYKRSQLMSGAPVNDETVAAKIRKGGPAMPAYGLVMSDADMADLVSYFREGKCCFDAEQPPRNPRYRGAPPRQP